MKERGILMSAPMALASLDDSKTQTRRVLKRQPDEHHWQLLPGYELKQSKIVTINERSAVKFSHSIPQNPQRDTALDWLLCPYGQPGDRLWVRETFNAYGRWETRFDAKKGRDEWHFIDMTLESGKAYVYAADGAPHDFKKGNQRGGITPTWWKRPAIFMPRAASRITLEITGVRVERLQDISEADAIAEGCKFYEPANYLSHGGWSHDGRYVHATALASYKQLWEAINGAGSWDLNPLVWVVEFKKATP